MLMELEEWGIYFDRDGVSVPKNIPDNVEWHHIRVPSVWQEIAPDYDGIGWYRTSLRLNNDDLACRLVLHFGAVHYSCGVFCNGREVGRHEGGYTPFSFDLSGYAKEGDNEILVRVLCPPREGEIEGMRVGSPLYQSHIPTWKAGWYYPFGGLWQAVTLHKLPQVFIDDIYIRCSISPKSMMTSFVVNNPAGLSEEVSVKWRVYKWNRDNPDIGSVDIAAGELVHKLNKPAQTLSIAVELPEALLWDTETPNLYMIELVLGSSSGVAIKRERFGLREFSTDGEYFFLNGKRIFLKGTLHQGVFPKRIAAAHDAHMARRDLELIKEANGNFVRLHIKPAPAGTLDIADEIGLLCMEEPPVGWITYDEHVVERAKHNVREMIRRDRNHPSLVMWCLFNELCDTVYAREHDQQDIIRPCAEVAREMDDSRLLIDTSGGRDNIPGEAPRNGIYLPGSLKPLPIVDVHIYQRLPLKSDSHKLLNSLGKGRDGLLFTSEFGTSSFPDMDRLLDGYSEEEKQKNFREYRQMKNYRDGLVKGFNDYSLADHFGTISDFYQALQIDHCQATDGMMRSIRNNARNTGYVITQHADAASEFGGIVDLWRQPKNVYKVFSECSADQLLSVQPDEPGVYSGESLNVTVTMSDITPDKINITGGLTIKFEGKNISAYPLECDGDLVLSCFSGLVSFEKPGRYTLEASVKAGDKAFTHSACVTAVDNPRNLITGPVAVYDLNDGAQSLDEIMRGLGYETRRFYNQFNDLALPVVVRMRGRDEMQRYTEMQKVLRQHVEAGGRVIFIDSELANMPHFFRHSMREIYGVGSYAGNCGFALDSSVFTYAGTYGHLGHEYAQGYPRIHALMDDVVGNGYTPLTMHVVPYQFGHPDDINWGCSSFTGKYGDGTFWVCQFHLEEFTKASPLMTSDFVRLIEAQR